MQKEHFYLEGEGGHITIVQKGNKYARISGESALADIFDNEKNINFNNLDVYQSPEEAFAHSSIGMFEYALKLVEHRNEHVRFSKEGIAIAKKMVENLKDSEY